MKYVLDLITTYNEPTMHIGITIIRIGIGLVFIRHGITKVINGPEEWVWLGKAMGNLGIHFFPMFWGLMAALTEFLGGICFTTGFFTRFAALFMAFSMFVAIIMHIKKGDPWGYLSHPLALIILFIGFIFIGSGYFSLDYFINRQI